MPSPNRIAYYRDRCQPPLTQRDLAQALDIHPNTIKNWERSGVPSVADLYRLVELFVERGAITTHDVALGFWKVSGKAEFPLPPELASLFDQRNQQSLPVLSALPVGSWLPFHRNVLFVGRSAEHHWIAEAFKNGHTAVALTGIGGIGKTQLAIEFAHQYGAFFSGGVFWLSFADAASVPTQIAACGGVGRMDLRANFSQFTLDDQVRLVHAAWHAATPRLLIFDNCEDEQLLARWRPTSGGGRVLVTSRRAHWNPVLAIPTLPIQALNRAESVDLLDQIIHGRHTLPPIRAYEHTDLNAIAAELGDLPLALYLAGNFLARYAHIVQPEQYLQHIRGQRVMTHPSMVSQASQAFSPTQHRQSIAETFALSYRQLDALDALDAIAMALLARIACFAPGESIADTLLQATLQDVVAPAESLLIEDARQRLLNLGLIESGTQRDIRMHRLLVDFVQQQIKETPVAEQARHAVEQAIFDIALQAERARAIDQIIALQRHLRPITDLAIPRSDAHALELCGVLGWHLTLLDENQPAAFYCEQALTIALHLYGDAHPQTAACYNRLGLRAQYVGAFTEAEPRFAQASMIWEQSYGSAHLQTLDAYHNLGYVQGLRGAYSSAFANLRRCANLRRRVLGLYHPETARTIHNIGRLHGWQGNARTALRYLQLAYRIRQQTLPPLHMALAQTLNAIGEAYFANNELAMAEQYHQQALTIRNTLFGLAHSETAESLMHIAHVWVKQGLLEAGRTQLEQALAIYIQFSGPHAIATAWCYECIGEVFEVLHDEAQAAFYLNQALAIYEAQYIPGDLRIQRLREHLLALPVQ